MKRKFNIILIMISLLVLFTVNSFASYNMNHRFSMNYTAVTIYDGTSPKVGNSTISSDYPTINSNFNVPRNASPSPHDGLDLDIQSITNQYVYTSYKSEVITTGGSGDLKYIILEVDSNNDNTIDDNVYLYYLHVESLLDGYTTGSVIQKGVRFTTINSEQNHLHFERIESSTAGSRYAYSPHQVFRPAKYNNGWATTYLGSLFVLGYNGQISIDSRWYTTAGVNGYPGSVVLYYKFPSATSWQSTTMSNNGNGTFTFNFPTNYRGTNVNVYFAGIRNDSYISSSYVHGLWPAYYKKPPQAPTAGTSYFTVNGTNYPVKYLTIVP